MDIDAILYKYFENIDIPKELNNIIEETTFKSKNTKNKLYNQYLLKVASIFLVFILLGSVVFARNIANYITERFANTHQGIVRAAESGYITNVDMDYISFNKTNIKVDSIMMDDFNLIITFNLKMEENIDNINYVEIPDLIITDENKNIVFCNYNDKEGYEKFCKKNHIPYSEMNMKNNYTDSGYATEIIQKQDKQITFTYKMYSQKYPKSKKLYINFKNIVLKANALQQESLIKNGIWKIEIALPEKFYNRELTYYTVKDGSDEKNDIKITNAIVSSTEMEIYFTSIDITDSKLEGEITEQKIEDKINAILNGTGDFYDDIEIENERGEIFKRTFKNDAGGIKYSFDGSISGSVAFTITKYDITDILKLRIIRENKEVVINLSRK